MLKPYAKFARRAESMIHDADTPENIPCREDQNYYGITIRRNASDLSAMKTAIHVGLFHSESSADRKLHLQHCPEGANSWCGYMRDQVIGHAKF